MMWQTTWVKVRDVTKLQNARFIQKRLLVRQTLPEIQMAIEVDVSGGGGDDDQSICVWRCKKFVDDA